MEKPFDLAVVGAGICGLAHALAAARRGKRVLVLDRELAATGASIRNFGFITVTGQEPGASWERARRTRDIWEWVMPRAGIKPLQHGLLVLARRPEALEVLEAFAASNMGEDCKLLGRAELSAYEELRTEALEGALHSPHEVRVESREAVPLIARFLETEFGVVFHRGVHVWEAAPPRIATSAGMFEAETVIVCPGDDFYALYAKHLADQHLTRCKLQMLRLAPGPQHLPPLMSDLGLVRYRGYLGLPGGDALLARLQAEQPDHLARGVHLIAVRSEDGSQVVGDSHVYHPAPDPFAEDFIDDLILAEYRALVRAEPRVIERWTGTYASGPETMVRLAPDPAVRIVIISSGTGASTSFAIAEDTCAELWG
jgi:FAD dependent oxidoreductase TIGR03364